jgi:ECF transporter S component (folate family)
MNISSRTITITGFLIALSILLTRVASIRLAIGGVEGIRIGFGGLPIILGGILFGPLYGGIIGAFSDILGYIINPIGAYMPHFTLTSALTGIIPSLILKINQKNEINVFKLGIAVTVGQVITSLILVPYFIHTIFGIPWVALMPARIIATPINIVIYINIINILIKRDILRPAIE